MAKIVTEKKIKEWVNQNEVIQNGNVEYAEGIKYDFCLGSRFLKAYFGRDVDYEKDLKTAEDMRNAVVEPGEVVFVLSKERLNLPQNVYVQLNPKRSLSQDGIELMGGLTVDPGYEGFLVFGLRNVAGTPFPLKPGIKIVGANFFELSDGEKVAEDRKPAPIEEFPTKLLDLIEKYKPVNPQNLEEELKKLQKAFEESQGQLVNDVVELKEKVGKISQELLIESTKREQENKVLFEKFNSVENKLESITRENIKHEENLNNLRDTLKAIDERTMKIDEHIISNNAEKATKKTYWTVIITFFITLISGIIIALFQGWIG